VSRLPNFPFGVLYRASGAYEVQMDLDELRREVQGLATKINDINPPPPSPPPPPLIVAQQPVMALPTFPALGSEQLVNAKLFGNRTDMIRSFDHLKGGKRIAEVGVLQGEFSEVLLEALAPAEFVALDLFDIHLSDHPWAKRMAEPFMGRTHLEYYQGRFPGKNIKFVQGDSREGLLQFPDAYFDMIYIDGDHTYEGVRRDTEAALMKIKPDGTLVFNDYILYDWNVGDFYGTVPIVNELVMAHQFEVIAFAFERTMFNDIAIRRPI